MKALLINGSPHANGNTAIALKAIEQVFTENNVEVTTLHVGDKQLCGCFGCGACAKLGRCIHDDIVNEAAEAFAEADCLIVGSPVHYASPTGAVVSFMDRLFMCAQCDKRMKVGAAVAVARRAGTTATFDVLNKYFTISGMPVVSSNYWNNLHGGAQGDALQDEEGLQTMRTLARNALFLMRSIELGKKEFGLPEAEKKIKTNYIR